MKISKLGLFTAAAYLLVALAVFLMHLYSVKANAGDSGESAIPFFLLALPWAMLIPSPWLYTSWQWLSYPVLWLYVLVNACIIYIVFSLAWWLVRQLAKTLGQGRKS